MIGGTSLSTSVELVSEWAAAVGTDVSRGNSGAPGAAVVEPK